MPSDMNDTSETTTEMDKKNKKKFSTSCGTYVTLLGFSLGTSDYWRMPFLVYRNGGGAFLIPFVITIIVCGIPLYFLEYSSAKFSGKGPYKIWDVAPIFRGVGLASCVAYSLYVIGSTIMRCWMLEFLFQSFQDPLPWSHCNNEWNTINCRESLLSVPFINDTNTSVPDSYNINKLNGSDSNVVSNVSYSVNQTFVLTSGVRMSAAEEFWQYSVIELSSGITDLYPVQWRYMLFLLAFRVVVLLCIIKSIKTLEKVMYVTTLVPILLMFAVLIRSLMLPGSIDGIHHFFYPNFSKLQEPRVWIEASLMAFYSLSFGWGGTVLIASHADFRENNIRTSIVLPILDATMAMLSGMACFSVLGNMAYTYNIHVTEVISAGMSTGIIAYVTALSSLPFPQIWSILFFVSFILCGLDNQMVPTEMTVQVIGEVFPKLYPKYRLHVLIGLSVGLFVIALPTCTGAGAYIFLWNDWYSGSWIGPIVAFFELTVFAWVYGLDRFSNDIIMMIGKPLPALLRILISFVTPIIVLVIFFTSCKEYIPPKYGSYIYPPGARVAGWLTVAIILLPIVVQAVIVMSKDKGPFLKKLKSHLKPLDSWGPCDKSEKSEFHETKTKYRSRTKTDVLSFNILGRYSRTSQMTLNEHLEQELTALGKA